MNNKDLGNCPGHDREVCAMCCWPKELIWGETIGLSADQVRALHEKPLKISDIAGMTFSESAFDQKAIDRAIKQALITGHGVYMIGGVENTIEVHHIDRDMMFYDPKAVEWQEQEPKAQYTAVDMATAAADGFRDGAKSVVVELPPSRCLPGSRIQLLHVDEVKAAIIAAGGSVK